eukprot:CAMPEP_0182531398 /NCGR_PEP_ID=MMETSP1323-20130603/8828_1 /TAXON_ID=236787 /ORGANISM="Florenciella parvula, Strain RCC1693" /LENGTH=65 /DNA_ID=CAMNT_0024740945 /DNA_START=56 /DNA_END=253 /DNA_ORIENTATION=-
MLRRAPTRLVLKPDDMKEYDEIIKERQAQQEANTSAASQQSNQFSARQQPTAAERIGFQQRAAHK